VRHATAPRDLANRQVIGQLRHGSNSTRNLHLGRGP
jgi:hypothetical protein